VRELGPFDREVDGLKLKVLQYCSAIKGDISYFFLVKYLVSIPGIIALILGETTGEIKKGFQELRQQVGRG
jgi:hypothetical protein